MILCSPTYGEGNIDFVVDPIGVGVGVGIGDGIGISVRVTLSYLHNIKKSELDMVCFDCTVSVGMCGLNMCKDRFCLSKVIIEGEWIPFQGMSLSLESPYVNFT